MVQADDGLSVGLRIVDRNRTRHADLAAAGACNRFRAERAGAVDQFLGGASWGPQDDGLGCECVCSRGGELCLVSVERDDVIGSSVGQSANRTCAALVSNCVARSQPVAFVQIHQPAVRRRIEPHVWLDQAAGCAADRGRVNDVHEPVVGTSCACGKINHGADRISVHCAQLDLAAVLDLHGVLGCYAGWIARKAADAGTAAVVIGNLVAGFQAAVIRADENRVIQSIDDRNERGGEIDIAPCHGGFDGDTVRIHDRAGPDRGFVVLVCDVDCHAYAYGISVCLRTRHAFCNRAGCHEIRRTQDQAIGCNGHAVANRRNGRIACDIQTQRCRNTDAATLRAGAALVLINGFRFA